MTDYFIDSNASGANDGTSWTDAWNAGTEADWNNAESTATTLGDRVAVAHDNATVCSANLLVSINANHTKEDPLEFIVSSATTGTTVTPVTSYGAASNGEIDGNTFDVGFSGNAYVYGLRIVNLDSSSIDAGGNSPVFERCLYEMSKTLSAENFSYVNGGECTFIDTDLTMSGNAHYINFGADGCHFKMHGGVVTTDANVTRIWDVFSAKSGTIECVGVDFTALNSGTDLVNGSSNEGIRATFVNCNWPATLPASWGSTISNLGDLDHLIMSGNQGEVSALYRYGSLLDEPTIRRASGANDGTADYSLKIESESTASRSSPFRHVMNVQNPGDLDTLTMKVHFANNQGALTNDQIWMECYTPTSSAISSDTDRNNLGASATTHTDESGNVDWRNGGSALTTYNEQSCSVTVSGTTAGLMYCVLCVADDFSTTNNLYVDPKVVIA